MSWTATDTDPRTTLTYDLSRSMAAPRTFAARRRHAGNVVQPRLDPNSAGTSFFVLYVSDGLNNNSASISPLSVGHSLG